MLFQHFVNNPKAAKENIEIGNAFLAENATKEGVQTTASGLQYLVLQEGTGTEHPTSKSKVKVHYHGTTINGDVFDSSVERGEPIEFGLGQVIKGWTEGVQLMVVGQKMRFFIPSNLAYGNRAAGSIQPGSVLIFDVELLDFK
ncbi:FKBP-type peptidyl-prolyl cis-trans isomerase [Aliivibrio sifiae]